MSRYVVARVLDGKWLYFMGSKSDETRPVGFSTLDNPLVSLVTFDSVFDALASVFENSDTSQHGRDRTAMLLRKKTIVVLRATWIATRDNWKGVDLDEHMRKAIAVVCASTDVSELLCEPEFDPRLN